MVSSKSDELMVLMVNWFLPHPLFSSQMILIFWEPGLRGIVFFLLNELSNSLVNGRSWPTSRWFLPWSVKWPPSGAMTATPPVVSASIKLFSNLLCTNFQITCQGKSAQQQLPSSSDNIIDYRWWVGGRLLGGWNLVCQKQKRNFSHFYSNRICYARVYLISCL